MIFAALKKFTRKILGIDKRNAFLDFVRDHNQKLADRPGAKDHYCVVVPLHMARVVYETGGWDELMKNCAVDIPLKIKT